MGLASNQQSNAPRRAFRIYGSRSRCTIRWTVPWWVGNSALLRSATPYGGGAVVSVFQLTEDVRLVFQCLLIILPSFWFIQTKYITLYFSVRDRSRGKSNLRLTIHFGLWRCWDFNIIFGVKNKIREVLFKCKGKGKAIPLQAWGGPEGSRRLRLPDFKTIGACRC